MEKNVQNVNLELTSMDFVHVGLVVNNKIES